MGQRKEEIKELSPHYYDMIWYDGSGAHMLTEKLFASRGSNRGIPVKKVWILWILNSAHDAFKWTLGVGAWANSIYLYYLYYNIG
jgi:hypothetical protein